MMSRNNKGEQPAVMITNRQQAFFKKHGASVNFKLNVYDDPKNQFPILAALLGWVEGCDRWNSHWRTCFGEKYIMPASNDSIVDQLAGLSITNVRPTRDDITDYTPSTSSATDDSSSTGVQISVWDNFPGFNPNPTAPFQEEFTRLAKSQGWSKKEKNCQRIAIFAADFEAHQGDSFDNLHAWQDLCRLCRIEPVPQSITQCKKALKSIYVNIYHILDAQRTGKKCKIFKSYSAFANFTDNYQFRFPLREAKADTFLKIFLKQLL